MPECPIADLSCPYCTPSCHCVLIKPWENCDDYMAYVDEEDEEDEE